MYIDIIESPTNLSNDDYVQIMGNQWEMRIHLLPGMH